MLNILFSATDNTVIDVDSYFNFNYLDEWFDDAFVKEMIKDIDKSEVVLSNCIQSPVLGQVSPTKLSGGVKALILMFKRSDLEIYATACGNNCANWIIKISEMHDIRIVLEHTMWFERDFEGFCLDNNTEIHYLDDYRKCLNKCL